MKILNKNKYVYWTKRKVWKKEINKNKIISNYWNTIELFSHLVFWVILNSLIIIGYFELSKGYVLFVLLNPLFIFWIIALIKNKIRLKNNFLKLNIEQQEWDINSNVNNAWIFVHLKKDYFDSFLRKFYLDKACEIDKKFKNKISTNKCISDISQYRYSFILFRRKRLEFKIKRYIWVSMIWESFLKSSIAFFIISAITMLQYTKIYPDYPMYVIIKLLALDFPILLNLIFVKYFSHFFIQNCGKTIQEYYDLKLDDLSNVKWIEKLEKQKKNYYQKIFLKYVARQKSKNNHFKNI
ncbi:hypothetical protein [Mycoplasma seminis]|uniref:Uncharacterized protein n=1 Tax=Mycoplasma seminis TaxID=512749 RepID=A0ABY9HA22_9MOLU|nr:hypothetical protein [Mycoplasma seminis]WLP85346.1 hypothetical protein Q8852_03430 [Mycoplasma seminis]